jgi:hypothetical protein
MSLLLGNGQTATPKPVMPSAYWDDRRKWVVLRVAYPLSFYAKGSDRRIDDQNAGWKGRGVWTTSGDRTPWIEEGGKVNAESRAI